MNKKNPSPTLPLSGEGAKPTQILSGEGVRAVQTLTEVGVKANTGDSHHTAPPPGKGEAGRGLKHPKLHNLKPQKNTRRQLRKNPTEPEKRFWSWVRSKQLGTKFRRQHGIGHYIVDFYCVDHALIIEIDGDSHYDDKAIAYDQTRTEFLKAKGFRVIRLSNRDIMQNKEGVLMMLMAILNEEHHEQ